MNIAYNCDCLVGVASLADESIDLTVTSPPYDNLRDYNGYTFDWHKTIAELYRVTKSGGVVVWVVADQTINGSETGTSFKQALYAMEVGFRLHDTMIFGKNNPVPYNHNRYEQCFEYMFIFSKGKPKTFNGIREETVGGGKVYVRTGGTQLDKAQIMRTRATPEKRQIQEDKLHGNIFFYTIGGGTTGHPAVFPLQLATDAILTWSDENDIVLDPFLGSGTTRIAAYDTNRQFIGYEIDADYFDKQEERFADYTAQTSLFHDYKQEGF